ncbi:MAG: PEGA domain-containing protein [Elusimicrobia bacterium]|nr:PEGA domain-containing protein [Candidatus Liberimonas magnetica]
MKKTVYLITSHLILTVLILGTAFNMSYSENQPTQPQAAANTKLTVAVSDLNAKGVSAMEASVVSDFLRDALTNTGVFNLVERSSMEQVLAEQKFQSSGCTTDECAVKMGKMLNVQRMILGSLSKLGEIYYVSVRIVDVEKGTIINAETVSANSLQEIQPACIQLADRITGRTTKSFVPPAAPTTAAPVSVVKEKGTLIIKSNPIGAELIIDGNSIGNTPAEIQLTAESHIIELKKGNMYWTDKVIIQANKIKNLNPFLQVLPTVIEITTEPKELKIYLNDKSYGYSPLKQEIAPGKYKVRIKKGGYKIYEDELTVLANKTNSFDIALDKIIKPPVRTRFGLGLHSGGASLRWLPGVLGFEAKADSGDNINITTGRLYINFNPRSSVIVYMGIEGGHIEGETTIQKFQGNLGGGFLGMEFMIKKHFSFNMDIGQYAIGLNNKEFKETKIEESYLVGNVGFNIYF